MLGFDPAMALGFLTLGGVAAAAGYFVVLITADLARARAFDTGFRCRFCGSPKSTPLLDSSRRFLGEVACLKCGETNRVPGPQATGAGRPGPSQGS